MTRRHPPADISVEIGCGSGEHLDELPAGIAVGLDIDCTVLVDTATRLTARDRALVCADARNVPVRAAAVSTVVLRAVLHHLDPVETALAELARILRPGGVLTIVDGTALAPEVASQLNTELAAAGLPPEPLCGFDLDELGVNLDRTGFDLESIRLDGTATFATPPLVSRYYRSDRFVLTAARARAR